MPIAIAVVGGLAVLTALIRSSGPAAGILATNPGSLRLQVRTAAQAARGWLGRLPRRLPFPGYSRYDDSDPLENDQRSHLYDHITTSPGGTLGRLVDETAVPRSTARYHLRILKFEGLVTRVELWGKPRYYPIEVDDIELHAALADEASRTVLMAVGRHEPASGSTLTDALDCDPSTVTYHLKRLSEAGVIERERDGRAVVNRLSPAARRALSEPIKREAASPDPNARTTG